MRTRPLVGLVANNGRRVLAVTAAVLVAVTGCTGKPAAPASSTPSAGATLPVRQDPSGTMPLPWRVLSSSPTSPRIVLRVGYGSCDVPVGYSATTTTTIATPTNTSGPGGAESVALTVYGIEREHVGACPANLLLVDQVVVLDRPLGNRVVTHAGCASEDPATCQTVLT